MVTRSPVGEWLQPWKSIDGIVGSSKAQALCQEIWPEVTAFGDAYHRGHSPVLLMTLG